VLNYHFLKTYRKVLSIAQRILISVLDGGEWLSLRSERFVLQYPLDRKWKGGWNPSPLSINWSWLFSFWFPMTASDNCPVVHPRCPCCGQGGIHPTLCGSLLPRHGAFSVCGWRRRPPETESSCEYIEYAVADSRHGVVLQLGDWARG
jgi:hypothetical protein